MSAFDHLGYGVDDFFASVVQDFYDITIPLGSGTQAYINAKFEATTAHITNATLTTLQPDQLYISFASAAFIQDTPAVTPQVSHLVFYFLFFSTFHLPTPCQIFALGTGDIQGMNQRLLLWLAERKGQRFGIISAFFDWISIFF